METFYSPRIILQKLNFDDPSKNHINRTDVKEHLNFLI